MLLGELIDPSALTTSGRGVVVRSEESSRPTLHLMHTIALRCRYQPRSPPTRRSRPTATITPFPTRHPRSRHVSRSP